jgi:hypothetical protein
MTGEHAQDRDHLTGFGMRALYPVMLPTGNRNVKEQLCIFGHVHAPASQLVGQSGHFYKSQEVIKTIIRHVKI